MYNTIYKRKYRIKLNSKEIQVLDVSCKKLFSLIKKLLFMIVNMNNIPTCRYFIPFKQQKKRAIYYECIQNFLGINLILFINVVLLKSFIKCNKVEENLEFNYCLLIRID